ncbi:hypothetical protein [Mesorhizobium sp.]|uniref:hypothetical protein n=1 Tax=Mesorhizobium sp. TaxID=1871066 RepID=UPI001208AC05|nr:hypothetical protein [Mesorhizobium sp.]TIT03717.1 MAG: hypothetical protein E5W87_03845 [Mesorhizobium sp.]
MTTYTSQHTPVPGMTVMAFQGRCGSTCCVTAEFVQGEILAEGALDGLNEEARHLVYLIADTSIAKSRMRRCIVGCVLEAMKLHPNGFPRYRDKAASLSALVNKCSPTRNSCRHRSIPSIACGTLSRIG